MNDFLTLLRSWKFVLIVAGVLTLLYIGSGRDDFLRFPPVDRSDYQTVADDFIRRSGFIAQRVGKITAVVHVGKGGEGGVESYNVFRVTGEDGIGVVNLTLTRDDSDDWYVTSADISIQGRDLVIPVKRSAGEKWRTFRLK